MTEVKLIEGNNREAFEGKLQTALDDGFELFSFTVTGSRIQAGQYLYTAVIKRRAPDDRMELASLTEITRNNAREIKKILRRIEVLEDTADDDTSPDDRVYALAITPSPGMHQVVIEALKEDDEIERELMARQILKDGQA